MTPRNPHGSLRFEAASEPLPVPALTSLTGWRIDGADDKHSEVTMCFSDRVEAVEWTMWLMQMQAVGS